MLLQFSQGYLVSLMNFALVLETRSWKITLERPLNRALNRNEMKLRDFCGKDPM